MSELFSGILVFLQTILPFIGMSLALIFLDLGLGIAAALKNKRFDFAKVAEFYKTNVLSYFLGWFVFSAFGSLVINNVKLLVDYQYIATMGFSGVTWAFFVVKLASSIVINFKDLYGKELSPNVQPDREAVR